MSATGVTLALNLRDTGVGHGRYAARAAVDR